MVSSLPKMIPLKLASNEQEYWIEKDDLIEASTYFRGMFEWDFKVSVRPGPS